MKINDDQVREQAIWAIGNIASDCVQFRDRVLESGIMIPLCECIVRWKTTSMIRTGVWTLSNLCRGKPSLVFSMLSLALDALVGKLYTEDEEILLYGCWVVSYISSGNFGRQSIIEVGLCRRLICLTLHENVSIRLAALRTIGNIVSGTDMQTEIVLNMGLFQCLSSLIQNPTNSRIRREACWIVSNIMAGDHTQIQRVIEAGLLPVLCNFFQNDEFEVRKQACYAFCNATARGEDIQLQ